MSGHGSKRRSPTELCERVTANVRRLRRMRRISTERLAAELTAMGCPMSRAVLTNRENGRAQAVTVDELFAFAAVLGVAVEDLVAETISCPRCAGAPPAGFACTLCGEVSDTP